MVRPSSGGGICEFPQLADPIVGRIAVRSPSRVRREFGGAWRPELLRLPPLPRPPAIPVRVAGQGWRDARYTVASASLQDPHPMSFQSETHRQFSPAVSVWESGDNRGLRMPREVNGNLILSFAKLLAADLGMLFGSREVRDDRCATPDGAADYNLALM